MTDVKAGITQGFTGPNVATVNDLQWKKWLKQVLSRRPILPVF